METILSMDSPKNIIMGSRLTEVNMRSLSKTSWREGLHKCQLKAKEMVCFVLRMRQLEMLQCWLLTLGKMTSAFTP